MSYKFDFGEFGGGILNFKNQQDLQEHIRNEISEWNKISTIPSVANYNQFAQQIISTWSNLNSQIANYNMDAYPEQFNNINSILNNFISSRQLISNKSVVGKRLFEVANKLGGISAYGALQVHIGNSLDGNNVFFQKGAMLYNLLELGLKPTNLALTTNTIENISNNLNESYNKFHSELETKSSTLIQRFEDSTEKFNKLIDEINIKFQTETEELIKFKEDSKSEFEQFSNNSKADFATYTQNSQEEFDKVLNLFHEFMKLEAPVEYWKEKAEKHEKNYKVWRGWPLWGFALGGLVALALLILSSWWIINKLLENDLAYSISLLSSPDLIKNALHTKLILGGAVGLLLLTLYIWSIRFVLRMVMTEHHLGIDARSRETMAKTYLAFNRENAANENEKAIILAALFKPVTDGLVKDDGMPAITPAALLQNMLTK